MKKLISAQFIILLVGTLFAWFNFTRELIDWLNSRSCTTGCAIAGTNPFMSACFYGAIFFTIAFVLSFVLFKKTRKLSDN
ncbi:MAG TPA: hypothetical protein VJ378_00785 [Candidatus Paceibacterota bacterium]|nr:hypothetical protein [Candidatus Paceibacterota bacterium]